MSLSSNVEALINANSAAVGGVIATFMTYPIDTLKSKLQASKTKATAGEILATVLKEQGMAGLFKGVEAKLVWSFVGKFVYYGSYSYMNSAWEAVMKGPAGFIPNLVLGYAAEFSTVPFSLPFEAIATRMQTTKGLSTSQAVTAIMKDDGVLGLYAGVSAYIPLCINPAITNTVFTQIKNILMRSRGKPLNSSMGFLESFLLGAVARTVAICFMYPFIRAKTVMQSPECKSTSALEVVKDMLKSDGFVGLYKGLGPELLRGVLSSAITMTLKERIYAQNRMLFLALTRAEKKTVVVQ